MFLHLGTLGVVVFYFRHDIKVILTALVHRDFHSEYGRFIPLIIVATIPTGIIGLLYDKFLADNYQTFLIIGVTFLFGAALVFFSKFGKENQTKISYRKALVMGAAQGAAIFPGLSRSGSTISSGLLQGVKREMVFKFSFLLSIPAIIGDLGVEAYLQEGSFFRRSRRFSIEPFSWFSFRSFSRLLSHCAGEEAGFNQEIPLLCRLHVCPWSYLDYSGSLRFLRRNVFVRRI